MLNVISVEEAAALSKRIANKIEETELVPLRALCGRTAAQNVYCTEELPAFRRSTMDGYAVFAADTFGASEALPADLTVLGEVCMGEEAGLCVTPGACVKISTGGMLPAGADAVVPVEYTDLDFDTCLVYRAVHPGENVVQPGDDVRSGALLIEKGALFTPSSIGILAAAGIQACRVYRKPSVGVLSTGNEVVPVTQSPGPGKVRDVNSHMLAALAGSYGCEARLYGIVPDDEVLLRETLFSAAYENDIVLLSGGSSAGERDLTARVIADLGEVLLHGLAMKPGKPTVAGTVNGKPVFGLPGHPAACYFVTEALVKPCVAALTGRTPPEKTVRAVLSENISSNHGREEWLCVKLAGGKAFPVYGKSGVVSQLAAADGYLRIPRDSEGLNAGAEVEIHLF